jgi:hypothetical protein
MSNSRKHIQIARISFSPFSYCSVNVTLMPCCTAPAVAVTVMTDVDGFARGVVPLPQPISSAPNPIAIAASRTADILCLRRTPTPSQQTATNTPPVCHGSTPLLCFRAIKDEATVIVVVAEAPCGVTVAGIKLHVTPAGRFEQANDTAWLKTASGVTVNASVPLRPRATVIAPEAAETEKSGEFTVSVSAVEMLPELFASPP